MGTKSEKPLHILFFPLMSPGHFIPMVDMAVFFSSRGVRSTLVTTPANAATVLTSSPNLSIITIPFPSPDETHLPLGKENLSSIPSSLFDTFTGSLRLFRPLLEPIIADQNPDCIISDSLFPWTADFDIPRLIFHGAGAFPLFITTSIFQYFPLDPEKESLKIDGIPPHKITLYPNGGLPDLFQNIPFLMEMAAGDAKSYGVVINTFTEMEPAYVDFQKGMRKAWCVGPVALCNKSEDDKAKRGGPEAAAAKGEVVNWLGSKPDGSVIYVCFGSLCHFGAAQLKEIALGLENSGANFLWVVRKEADGDGADESEWMPEGYEGRVGGRGMVVRGWAPQAVVLEHPAVGWFVTHCGWNSLQESVSAGVPMVTWPLFHEQFINAEMVVEVMGIGARMWEGFRKSDGGKGAVVATAEEIAGVVKRVTGGGEEYAEMRVKAKELGAAAHMAVEEGGSSFEDVTALIEELKARRSNKE